MTKPLDSKAIEKLAFGLYPHVFPLGEGQIDGEALGERLNRIRSGLLPETEFFSTVSWLGNCAGIFRLDQTPMPIEGNATIRAPDFLAFVNHNERIVPILIEVKKTDDEKLVWSEAYLQSLTTFAQTVNLPLLVAWKWHEVWLLVDYSHFTKHTTAYHLTKGTAFTENLMSMAFGNVHVQMDDEMTFVMKGLLVDHKLKSAAEIPSAGTYQIQIKGAAFRRNDDSLTLSEVNPELFLLFLTAPTENRVNVVSEHEIEIIYAPEAETSIALSHVLLTFLYMTHQEEELDWDKILREGPFTSSGKQFRDALEIGLEKGFVKYVFEQVPQTIPPYFA
jgi:Holliday junction resolvase